MDLTPHRLTLRHVTRTDPDPHVRHRADALLLIASGRSLSQAATRLGACATSLRHEPAPRACATSLRHEPAPMGRALSCRRTRRPRGSAAVRPTADAGGGSLCAA
jgi:hypothetical protein